LLKPITTTNIVILGKNTKNGIQEGIKGSLNNKVANNWLPTKDNKIPVKLPKTPR